MLTELLSQRMPGLRMRGALRTTQAPKLLIRRNGRTVQDRPLRSVRWADFPELSARDRRCPATWQQRWQHSRLYGFDIVPVAVGP